MIENIDNEVFKKDSIEMLQMKSWEEKQYSDL